MRIAIIGGGASGLCAAYKLQDAHEVHLFEKRDRLGGNISTLNGNVSASSSRPPVRIEAGVLGFHQASYPTVHQFFDELGVERTTKRPTSALFLDNAFLPSDPSKLATMSALPRLLTQPGQLKHLIEMRGSYRDTFRRVVRREGLPDVALEALTGDDSALNSFVRSLAALAFSTSGNQSGALPASMVGPYLNATRYPEWTALKGGVWSYIEKLLDKKKFRLSTGVQNVSVTRSAGGVTVQAEGDRLSFNEVIIATTPGQVLNIIRDPDERECRLFETWSDHSFATKVHTSDAVYGGMRKLPRTPMDLFIDSKSGAFGYNTYMNEFYDIHGDTPYSFSYNLDDRIPDASILHAETHTVPTYTVASRATVDDIWDMNGDNNTWFCGAYLGDGLHEGAIESAHRVAKSVKCDGKQTAAAHAVSAE